ncbi:globin domain-containing protein [Jannaschia sp.]|nr:globin domain-containing protein [Jannaschia sp.]
MERVSSKQAQALSASLGRIESLQLDLAAAFYAALFSEHPQVRPMFPDDMAALSEKLTNTVAFVVAYATRPGMTYGQVCDLAVQHVGLGVTAETYLLVEPAFMAALTTLEDAQITPEEREAWSAMLREICATMMQETVLNSA